MLRCTAWGPQEQDDGAQDDTESLADGYASVASGLASTLPSGIETPSEIDLRKRNEGARVSSPAALYGKRACPLSIAEGWGARALAGPKQLYQVLEQQKASVATGQLMGSDHTYVIPGQERRAMTLSAQVRGGVPLPRTLQPSPPSSSGPYGTSACAEAVGGAAEGGAVRRGRGARPRGADWGGEGRARAAPCPPRGCSSLTHHALCPIPRSSRRWTMPSCASCTKCG